MTKLYDHVFEMLGKSIDGPEFRLLIKLVGNPSVVYDVDGADITIYEFHHSGFGISYNKTRAIVCLISFEYSTLSVENGVRYSFAEELHAGISRTDGPAEVEAKLGVTPKVLKRLKSTGQHMGWYEIFPYDLFFTFSGTRGPLDGMAVTFSEKMGIPGPAHLP